MRYLVFSDIHGNLPAFEKMLSSNEADGYICLGDVVNYGPWSNECVALLNSLPNSTYLEGNHEEYFLNGIYPGDNIVAKTFFEFCFPFFNEKAGIEKLPKKYELNGFTFSHTIFDRYIYPDSVLKLDTNYVVGHSHHQFKIEQPPFTLLNPGSVGQNREHINVINYMILESETMEFELKSIVYNANLVIDEMRLRKYPQLCVDYYNDKKRA